MVTKLPIVLVGAYGFRDCDPLATIVATSPACWDAGIQEQLDIEREASFFGCDCEGIDDCSCADPDLWSAGPFPEGLLSVLRRADAGRRDELLADLATDGWAVIVA